MDEIYKNNLRALRIKNGLTQLDVAQMLGHKYQDRISKWELGVNVPSLQNLIKLCEIFDTTLQESVRQGLTGLNARGILRP